MSNVTDYIKLHFIVLIWGFTAILGVLISIPSIEIVFYRTGFAAVFLLGLLFVQKRKLRVPLTYIFRFLATGIIIAGHWILFFTSAKVSTASVCLAGMATVTLWTSIIEPVFYKRKIRGYEVFLGLIVIAGLYIIFRFELNNALGLILAVISAFLGALFSVFNSKFTVSYDPYVITCYEMIGACLTCLVFLPLYPIIFPDIQSVQLGLNIYDFLYLVVLSLICTVYAFSESVELMRRISAYAVNLTVNLEPVYGIILAVFILNEDEKMSSGFYWGTLVIILSVLSYPMINRYYKNKALGHSNIRY
jgi:drug/metabolite transporter (DMT)-like permease